jgi:hypothetical protein
MSSDKPMLTNDQSTLTQPLTPVTDSCKSPMDTGPADDCTGGASTRQCDDNDDRDDDDECNEDLQDEELEVGDEESDAARREAPYENQLQYFDNRIRDDCAGSRASPSPSVPRDTEDLSPPVFPKPLHHPGLALGHAGSAGPPCWGFPSGLASHFAWMPVYRPVSPSSEYRRSHDRTGIVACASLGVIARIWLSCATSQRVWRDRKYCSEIIFRKFFQ